MLKDKLAMARANEIAASAYRLLRNWEINLIDEIKERLDNGLPLSDLHEAMLERMYDRYISKQIETTAG